MLVRLLALLLLLSGARPAWAQGRLAGQVSTTGGSGVQGARVMLVGTTLQTFAGPSGAYRLDNVPVGTYTLRVSRLGYQAVVALVAVGQDQLTTVNVVLVPLPVRDVLVSASPPDEPLPIDSLRFPVPDSAIVRYRQTTRVIEMPAPGSRAVIRLFPNSAPEVSLTVIVTGMDQTPTGQQAQGDIVDPNGVKTGSFVLVVRDNVLTANFRDGLRLFQIRPQARGIYLIVEVDQSKLPREASADAADYAPCAAAATVPPDTLRGRS